MPDVVRGGVVGGVSSVVVVVVGGDVNSVAVVVVGGGDSVVEDMYRYTEKQKSYFTCTQFDSFIF